MKEVEHSCERRDLEEDSREGGDRVNCCEEIKGQRARQSSNKVKEPCMSGRRADLGENRACVCMHVCSQSAGMFPRSGSSPQAKRDPGWHRSITNADGCPFATRLIFIYLSVYLCLVYLLMEHKDLSEFPFAKKEGETACSICTWMNSHIERMQHVFTWIWVIQIAHSSPVMEKWYGPFSYLAVILQVSWLRCPSLSFWLRERCGMWRLSESNTSFFDMFLKMFPQTVIVGIVPPPTHAIGWASIGWSSFRQALTKNVIVLLCVHNKQSTEKMSAYYKSIE